jgi:hypothetical protein
MNHNGIACGITDPATTVKTAAMERFFSMLKTEQTSRKTFSQHERGQSRYARLHRAVLRSRRWPYWPMVSKPYDE